MVRYKTPLPILPSTISKLQYYLNSHGLAVLPHNLHRQHRAVVFMFSLVLLLVFCPLSWFTVTYIVNGSVLHRRCYYFSRSIVFSIVSLYVYFLPSLFLNFILYTPYNQIPFVVSSGSRWSDHQFV